jgi:hypothetical protein
MLPHGVQHGVDAKRQASAELSGNFDSLTGLLPITMSLEVDGFVERYTEHAIDVFELFGVIREERPFSVGKDGSPVLLDGVVPTYRGTGIQKVSPKKGQYSKTHSKWHRFVAAGCFGPLYSPFISIE